MSDEEVGAPGRLLSELPGPGYPPQMTPVMLTNPGVDHSAPSHEQPWCVLQESLHLLQHGRRTDDLDVLL